MRFVCTSVAAVTLMLSLAPAFARAQDARDPTQDLLNTGRRSLDDLNYRSADSIATLVLSLPRLARAHRIQALQLAAAARFPESRADRQPSRSEDMLRDLVRMAPDARIPAGISWSGLDSLHAAVRQRTFGSAVIMRDSVPIRGFAGRVTIEAMATRPAVFHLTVRPLSGASEGIAMVDSAGPSERVELGFQPVMGEVPRLPSGDYRAEIVAVDRSTGERLTNTVRIRLHTPPLPLHRIADRWDSAGARAIRTRPSRSSSIASGIIIGGFTALAGTVRRPERLGDRTGASPITWGIGLGISTAAVSWVFDKGRVIPRNVQHNDSLQTRWVSERQRLLAENDASSQNYVGYAQLTLENP